MKTSSVLSRASIYIQGCEKKNIKNGRCDHSLENFYLNHTHPVNLHQLKRGVREKSFHVENCVT